MKQRSSLSGTVIPQPREIKEKWGLSEEDQQRRMLSHPAKPAGLNSGTATPIPQNTASKESGELRQDCSAKCIIAMRTRVAARAA